jgi:hypothetical protein
MVIMTKEHKDKNDSVTSFQNRSINYDARKILENINIKAKERKESFENLTPPCPQDGKSSRFVRYDGSYMRVKGVFRCEDGHEFFLG